MASAWALALVALAIGGCARDAAGPPPPLATTGPAADYPVTVGAPYTIAGKTYEPADTLNYDEVGQAVAGSNDAAGITAAHHTLPVPAYAEVTALTTGRTILVRVERRGPMDSTALVALSPAALDQLGARAPLAVRVRRVNPPEAERALLRQGGPAPARMDTPMSLVEVLRRRSPDTPVRTVTPPARTAAAAAPTPAATAGATAAANPPRPVPRAQPDEVPTSLAGPVPARTPAARAAPAAAPNPSVAQPAASAGAATGRFYVQAAAFSTQDRATRAAAAIGGSVERAGRYWRLRTGPFPTRAAADASLAKVKAAGYSDARIQTAD